MVPRDVVLVGVDEVPVANDLLAAHVEAIDAMRRTDLPENGEDR